QRTPGRECGGTQNRVALVEGNIKSMTFCRLCIGLDGGIVGLVYLSDISWNVAGEEAVREYKKGDEIAAAALQVEAEREGISRGGKQLAESR
ncbi:S1 RNA-binding domain-containing protein, partial [Klebsiella pneumoniae]|nr:S1 RNA-binding domain-containing protein [Klebsiella pneumoniae]